MTEKEITKIAVQVLLRDVIGSQPAIWPTCEIADEDRLRPDCLLVALDDDLQIDELDEIHRNDLVVHAIESKIARQYLIGSEFSGVTQASDYYANYNWLVVPTAVALSSTEWTALFRACERERIGLILCNRGTGKILLQSGYDDIECCTSYPCWPEIFDGFCRQYGFSP